jgi:hypothetical protein
MWDDPIVKDVRKIRDAHAAKFGYDLHAIFQDLKRQEKESNCKYINLPPKIVSRKSEPYTKKSA